jgi:rhodanese-related sulfurtransferase
MKDTSVFVVLLFACMLVLGFGIAFGGPQTKCPVMGGKVDAKLFVDVSGHRVYVCCAGCLAPVKANPAKYLAKIKANGEEPVKLCKCGAPKGSVACKAACAAKSAVGTACASCAGKGGAECKGGVCKAPAVLTVKPSEVHKVATIDTAALATLLKAKVPMVVFDARSGKYDDGRRIPGATQLSSKATAAQVAKAIPKKDSLVVTYCSNLKCPASAKLAKHLKSLGYTNVIEYPKGIQGWAEAGQTVVTEKKAVPKPKVRTYEGSRGKW